MPSDSTCALQYARLMEEGRTDDSEWWVYEEFWQKLEDQPIGKVRVAQPFELPGLRMMVVMVEVLLAPSGRAAPDPYRGTSDYLRLIVLRC